MKHLFEILKIVDGALNADHKKVLSYAELLAEKLEGEGEAGAAGKIKSVLDKSNIRKLNTAKGVIENIPRDSESKMSLAEREIFNEKDVDIFLEQDQAQLIQRFIQYTKSAAKLISKGVEFPPSIILSGPPGCGKSEVAKYISARLGLPLVTARLDGIISSYLGSTAKNLRTIFEFANSQPCVLFLDEFDALAKVRDDANELGELKRVVVSLLQNLDRLDSSTVLVAATNHEHLLDPAVWRRFTYKMQIAKPTQTTREKLFSHFLGSFCPNEELVDLAELSEGLSGSDIKQIAEDAKREAIIGDVSTVDVVSLKKVIAFNFILKGRSDISDSTGQMKLLRSLNEKAFTYRVLSQIFQISTGQISSLLKEASA